MKGTKSMKLQEITPSEYLCAIGACPAIFRTDRGTFLIVGRTLSISESESLIPGRLNSDETAVEIPITLLQNITNIGLR
jgi:hypothetical protein